MKTFPVIFAGESRSLVFRFTLDLLPGESVVQGSASAITVFGTHPAPNTIFVTEPTVTGGTDIIVPVNPIFPNTDYKVTATATTSTGRVLKFAARLAVRNP